MTMSVMGQESLTAPETNAYQAADPASRLRRELTVAIESGVLKPGEQLPPLRELARQYDTSFAIVRGVVEQLERDQLVQMRRGSGPYINQMVRATTAIRPAAATPGSALESVAAAQAVGLHLRFNDHVYGLVAHDLIELLHHQRINTVNLALPRDLDPENYRGQLNISQWPRLRTFVTQMPDFAVNYIDAQLPREIRRIMLRFGSGSPLPPGWHVVSSDTTACGRIVAEHLVGRGHRRIGLVTHSRTIQTQQPETLRKRTFGHTSMIVSLGAALRDLGLRGAMSVHYMLRYNALHPDRTPDAQFGGKASDDHIARWLNAPNRPTAMVGTDFLLFHVKRVAEGMGLRVPQDLELLGIGNTPYSQICGFASMSYDESEIARQLANLILTDDRTLGRSVRHQLVLPQLVLR
ncbi:MAG: substrate-binding domain-containing protein [Phycisphaeraceae bacterium]|nr:substrate-binding domain-containing protein [Phycisphaeraceae bacterium]